MLIHNPIFTGSISLNGSDISQISTVSTDSSSFALRITNNESTSSAFIVASGSLAARLTSNEALTGSFATTSSLALTSASVAAINVRTGSFATTGSNQFNGNQIVTGSLTATGTIVAQTLVVQTVTSSVVYSSGSNIFGLNSGNNHQFTGSIFVSGSVGIGTTSLPYGNVAIKSNSATSYAGLNVFANSNLNFLALNHTGTTGIIETEFSTGGGHTPLAFLTNGTERMRITTSGSVGIGTNNPSTKVHIYESLTNTSAYLTVQNNRARNAAIYTVTSNGGFYAGTSIGTDTFNYQIYDGVAGLARLTISSTGTSTFSTTENQGGLYVTSATDNTTIRVASTATGGQEWRLQATGGTSGLGQGKLIIKVGGTESASDIPLTLTTDNGTNGGRVGIGTTNPQLRLHVVNIQTANSSIFQLRLEGNGGNYFDLGRHVDTGAFRIQGNQVGANNIVLAPTSGNVGIGTTSPTQGKLVVSNAGPSVIANRETSVGVNSAWNASDGSVTFFGNLSNHPLLFITNDTERMRITSGGSLQIGSSSGSGAKTLIYDNRSNSTSLDEAALYVRQDGTNAIQTWSSGGAIERMRIDSNGNVGIVTSGHTLGNTLQLGRVFGFVQDINSGYIQANMSNAGNYYISQFAVRIHLDSALGNINFLTAASGTAGNAVSLSNRMQITAGGETLLNTTSVGAGFVNTCKFGSYQQYTTDSNTTTLSTQRTAGLFAISGGDNSNNQGSYTAIVANVQVGASNNPGALFRGYQNTNLSVQINFNGNITNTNGSYGAISDISLKENIVDTTPKLDDLLNVKVRNYNLIGDETKQIGVIAQELEEIFPKMIETNSEGLKSVKYSVFVPMLIKAIQEQQAQIDTLKALLNA